MSGLCNAARAAGHHGCALACQAPISVRVLKAQGSFRISWAYARCLPFCAGTTSRHNFRDCQHASLCVIDLITRHQCPCDARHLIRQRHGHQPNRPALKNPSDPNSSGTIPLWSPTNHGCGSYNQQPAYLPIAGFGDPAKAGFPAGGMLSRHQTKPGGEMSCTLEDTNVGDGRRNQGCGDRPNAGNQPSETAKNQRHTLIRQGVIEPTACSEAP